MIVPRWIRYESYEVLDCVAIDWNTGEETPPSRFLIGRGRFSRVDPHQAVGAEHRRLARLYCRLARCKQDERAVLALAKEFGTLSSKEAILDASQPYPETRTQLWGVSVDRVLFEIRQLRCLFDLWTATSKKDLREVRKIIKWHGQQRVTASWPDGGWRTIESSQDSGERVLRLQRYHYPDVVGPALDVLRDVVNEKLLDHNVRFKLLAGASGIDLRLVAESPMGYAWLQFAEAIAGGKKLKFCEFSGCGEAFEIGNRESASRSDRKYCSDRCKMRASRERAKELGAS